MRARTGCYRGGSWSNDAACLPVVVPGQRRPDVPGPQPGLPPGPCSFQSGRGASGVASGGDRSVAGGARRIVSHSGTRHIYMSVWADFANTWSTANSCRRVPSSEFERSLSGLVVIAIGFASSITGGEFLWFVASC